MSEMLTRNDVAEPEREALQHMSRVAIGPGARRRSPPTRRTGLGRAVTTATMVVLASSDRRLADPGERGPAIGLPSLEVFKQVARSPIMGSCRYTILTPADARAGTAGDIALTPADA
jgi:hypothetical protein